MFEFGVQERTVGCTKPDGIPPVDAGDLPLDCRDVQPALSVAVGGPSFQEISECVGVPGHPIGQVGEISTRLPVPVLPGTVRGVTVVGDVIALVGEAGPLVRRRGPHVTTKVTLVGGGLPQVSQAVPLVRRGIPLLGNPLPGVGRALAFIQQALPVADHALPLVGLVGPPPSSPVPVGGGGVPQVRQSVSLVGRGVALLGDPVPLVGRTLPLVHCAPLVVVEACPQVSWTAPRPGSDRRRFGGRGGT